MRLAACKTLAGARRSVKGVVFASNQAFEGGDEVPATDVSDRNHGDIDLETTWQSSNLSASGLR